MSKIEVITNKKMWRSGKLYKRRVNSLKSLTTYFGETKFAKKNGMIRYSDYLNSEKWREKSFRYKIKFPICEYCRKNKSVHVHHRNYQNVGHEKYWDLIATCEECHKKQHGI